MDLPELPRRYELIQQEITRRCKFNINKLGHWDELETSTIHAWLNNFQGCEHSKFFAYAVLDTLLYVNKKQVLSQLSTLLNIILPEIIRHQRPDLIQSFENLLNGKKNEQIFFVGTQRKEEFSSSSPATLRLLKTHFKIRKENITSIWEGIGPYEDGDRLLVLIDDFSGTGKQIVGNLREEMGVGSFQNRLTRIYTPLVMHTDAKMKLEGLIRDRYIDKVLPVEWIDQTYNCFNPNSRFTKHFRKPADAKQIYKKILKDNPRTFKRSFQYGWGNQSLLFSFGSRCPNNSLPILWTNSENWVPLLPR